MCCASKSRTGIANAKKRVIALAFLISLIAVSLLSEMFILTHAYHRHDHNGNNGSCAACARVQTAENTLTQLGTAIKTALFAFSGFLAVISVINSLTVQAGFLTPVSLKIRMNN